MKNIATNIDPHAASAAHPSSNVTPEYQSKRPIGGLSIRTDLRAGLALDDLDDQAKELWNSLTASINGLLGGADSSS